MFGLAMPKLLLYGLIALAILGMIGTGIYKVKQWGANEVQMEWDQAQRDQREKELNQANKAATGFENDRAKAKTVYVEIEKRVVEYIDRPVYDTVCIDPDGLRNINDALDGEITIAPVAPSGVPKVTTPNRIDR